MAVGARKKEENTHPAGTEWNGSNLSLTVAQPGFTTRSLSSFSQRYSTSKGSWSRVTAVSSVCRSALCSPASSPAKCLISIPRSGICQPECCLGNTAHTSDDK
ncbi:hypothetical protein Q8A67_019137 [Cirrhinus molitorella]|uniref:Uncharacterized protein n=1 Tax=Cirrhinus molitorella TaxID=172907 RepID=A0AA88PBT5_9TELE|nr:hypothetical protein Q8A67_019137 [Cirrhinus molitorella]